MNRIIRGRRGLFVPLVSLLLFSTPPEPAADDESAGLWERANPFYNEEDRWAEGHRILNDHLAAHPGDLTDVPPILLRLAAEDCFEVFNTIWRDFAMRTWLTPRIEGGMKTACDEMIAMIRWDMENFLIPAELRPTIEYKDKPRQVIREALNRTTWEGRKPGSRDLSDQFNQWPDEPVQRLFALHRAGFIPDSEPALFDAGVIMLYARLRQSRYQEASELYDRIVDFSREDPTWVFARARFHDWMESPRRHELFKALFQQLDDRKQDDAYGKIRSQAESYNRYRFNLERNQPDEWHLLVVPNEVKPTYELIESGFVHGAEPAIDALIGEALADDMLFLRKDRNGGVDAWQVIDDHLVQQPPEALKNLRTLQESKCRRDVRAAALEQNNDRQLRALYRRYPWARTGQAALLLLGRRQLHAGRSRFARRTFGEVLHHAIDPSLRKPAMVGRWVAVAEDHDAATLKALFEGVDDGDVFPW
ncbi:MAG: hypothetical protein AAF492_17930, partial [Verrucomicrobiota bacterium]